MREMGHGVMQKNLKSECATAKVEEAASDPRTNGLEIGLKNIDS